MTPQHIKDSLLTLQRECAESGWRPEKFAAVLLCHAQCVLENTQDPDFAVILMERLHQEWKTRLIRQLN